MAKASSGAQGSAQWIWMPPESGWVGAGRISRGIGMSFRDCAGDEVVSIAAVRAKTVVLVRWNDMG